MSRLPPTLRRVREHPGARREVASVRVGDRTSGLGKVRAGQPCGRDVCASRSQRRGPLPPMTRDWTEVGAECHIPDRGPHGIRRARANSRCTRVQPQAKRHSFREQSTDFPWCSLAGHGVTPTPSGARHPLEDPLSRLLLRIACDGICRLPLGRMRGSHARRFVESSTVLA